MAAETATERTGLIFAGAPSVPEMVALAQRAEKAGFESVWIAETRMTRDAFVPMAAMAQATQTIRVGSGIVNVYTRGPVVLAIAFRGLAELASGRIVLGLGAGSPNVLAPQGIAFERPLTRLREYCEVLPPLMRGEPVTYDGRAVRLDGARVEDVLSGHAGPAADMPLYLGVTGARALRYAGEVADGVLMNVCLPTDYVTSRMTDIQEGAATRGRTLDEIDIAMAILVSPHEDSATGRDRAREFVGLYLAMMPNIAQETGVDPGLVGEIAGALHADGVPAAARLVPDEVVDRLAAAGTPEECRRRLDEYRAAGVGLVVLTPVAGALESSIELLAPRAR